MFGLFAAKCPVTLREKYWLESRLGWLASRFGRKRLLEAPTVLPTGEFFPDRYDPSVDDDALALCARVCEYLDVRPDQYTVTFADCSGCSCAPRAPSDTTTATIELPTAQRADRESLIGMMACEIGRDVLLQRGFVEGDNPELSFLSELVPFFYGLGIFRSNTVLQKRAGLDGQMDRWSLTRNGTLPAQSLGYVFAIHSWLRGEDKPIAEKWLGADAAGSFRRGRKFLARTGDCLVNIETIGEDVSRLESHALLNRLNSDSDTQRLSAIVALQQAGEIPDDALDPLVGCLDARDQALRCEAVIALAFAGEAAAPHISRLIEYLIDDNSEMRANCAVTLGRLRTPLEAIGTHGETIEYEFRRLLGEGHNRVTLAVAHALAQHGPAAADLSDAIVLPLRKALTQCDSGDWYLNCLTAITQDADTVLRREMGDQELLALALTDLERLREDADSTSHEPEFHGSEHLPLL